MSARCCVPRRREAAALAAVLVVASACGGFRTRTPSLRVGDRAPDFELVTSRGDILSFDELRADGPVLLVFYRGHASASCRAQLGELARQRARFDELGAKVAAISVDTMEDSARMVDELRLGFAVLRDADLSVSQAYGVAMQGADLAVPAVFVVRRDGTIAYRYVGTSETDRPPVDRLVREAGRAAGRE